MVQDDASSWFASQEQQIQDFEVPPAPESEPLNPEPDFDPDRPFGGAPTVTDEDVRLTAGVALGAGLSYSLFDKWEVGVDAIYYYDLTSHHKGYAPLADPRYLNTLSVNLNINYKL